MGGGADLGVPRTYSRPLRRLPATPAPLNMQTASGTHQLLSAGFSFVTTIEILAS